MGLTDATEIWRVGTYNISDMWKIVNAGNHVCSVHDPSLISLQMRLDVVRLYLYKLIHVACQPVWIVLILAIAPCILIKQSQCHLIYVYHSVTFICQIFISGVLNYSPSFYTLLSSIGACHICLTQLGSGFCFSVKNDPPLPSMLQSFLSLKGKAPYVDIQNVPTT